MRQGRYSLLMSLMEIDTNYGVAQNMMFEPHSSDQAMGHTWEQWWSTVHLILHLVESDLCVRSAIV
jgi:hypothetical protein